jgi:Spy/CpxP family protein refolding chaperone
MKNLMKYAVLGLALALSSSTFAHASTVVVTNSSWWSIFFPPHNKPTHNDRTAPEVDPGLALSGIALLGGSLTVLRARRSKRS